jgi:DNA-binding transcriptional regulator YiaG
LKKPGRMSKDSPRFSKHLTPLEKPPSPDAISVDELRALLGKLNLSTGAAARLLGVNDRTVRRWWSGDAPTPPPVARFLRYIHRARVSPQQVMETLSR